MAFIAGTQIFTDSGFKNIEDIAGRDKVLVRNFIGSTEFLQPFALKKRQYDGDILSIGSGRWGFSVTPEHLIVYASGSQLGYPKYVSSPAGELNTTDHDRIQRAFKYNVTDEHKKEVIRVGRHGKGRSVTISNEDWYVLTGYVLTKGLINKGGKRDYLVILSSESKVDRDVKIIGDILDRYGIGWSLSYTAQPVIIVSSQNTLAARIITRFKSRKRKEMRPPDSMVYGSSRALIKLLMDTITSNCSGDGVAKQGRYIISTSNIDLINTLMVMGTLGGYSMSKSVKLRAGESGGRYIAKRDNYNLTINPAVDTYSVKSINRKRYSGPVYEIDLFDGQVYVRSGAMPVWVNPK